MKFKINDYVRVKPGTKFEETDELIHDCVGRIDELPDDPNAPAYLLEFDAFSLENLPPKYLQNCIDEEQPALGYYFLESELEPAVRRDSDGQLQAAQDKINHGHRFWRRRFAR